jgi:hypothetical protein
MADDVGDLMLGIVGPPKERDCILMSDSTVIHHCKEKGVRFWVSDKADASQELKANEEGLDPQAGPLVRLWEAFSRHDINYMGPGPGLTQMKSNWLVPKGVHASLSAQLADDCSDIRRLSTWPITRCFVYVDVSDFSRHRPGEQALIVGSLISMVRDSGYWNPQFALLAWRDVEAMICIGDGYIFVLKDVVWATYFAAYLAQLIEVRVARKLVPVEFHFRMGVHVGPVFCFWDWGRGGREPGPGITRDAEGKEQRTDRGDWNYIGDGINGGQRVLAAAGKETDDVLFISGQVRQELIARGHLSSPNDRILNSLLNRGRRADKHNNFWRVYEVSHASLCGPDLLVQAKW